MLHVRMRIHTNPKIYTFYFKFLGTKSWWTDFKLGVTVLCLQAARTRTHTNSPVTTVEFLDHKS